MSLAAQQKGCTEPQGLSPCQSLPAVHHDGTAEEIAESIHPPSKFEEQVGVFRNPVIWPAGELDVCYFSPSGFLFFLVKRWCILWDVFFQSKLKGWVCKIRGPVQWAPHVTTPKRLPQTLSSGVFQFPVPWEVTLASHVSPSQWVMCRVRKSKESGNFSDFLSYDVNVKNNKIN